MKVPDTIKWMIGVAALVLLPANATWPSFLVEPSDYYAEMRLSDSNVVVVVAKNTGTHAVVVTSPSDLIQVTRTVGGTEEMTAARGSIPSKAYAVLFDVVPTVVEI